MADSLEDKTIRPGSLAGYSYYHSDRHAPEPLPAEPKKRRGKRLFAFLIVLALIAALAAYAPKALSHKGKANGTPSASASQTPAAAPLKNPCAGNTLNQLILVSISKRHLWACQYTKELYSSPVVTGITTHPDTTTPTGSYQVYGKVTDTTLTGSDSTGTWSDPVHYWMPFLYNQYGAYGLHDATWRPNNAFGNIDPSSARASQGCVELPLATASWIFNWVQIGTTITIQN